MFTSVDALVSVRGAAVRRETASVTGHSSTGPAADRSRRVRELGCALVAHGMRAFVLRSTPTCGACPLLADRSQQRTMRKARHESLPNRRSADDEHHLVSAVGEGRDLVTLVP